MMIVEDGIRGLDGSESSIHAARGLGRALVRGYSHRRIAPPTIVVGRAPSTVALLLAQALEEGIVAEGGRVIALGVVPRYIVRRECMRYSAYAGITVTVDDMPHLGCIRLIIEGRLPSPVELRRLFSVRADSVSVTRSALPVSSERRSRRLAIASYLGHLRAKYPSLLRGYLLSVDSAYGSLSYVAPRALSCLGATVKKYRCRYDTDLVGCGSGIDDVRRLRSLARDGSIAVCFDGSGERVAISDGIHTVTDYGVDHVLKKRIAHDILPPLNLADPVERTIVYVTSLLHNR